MIFYPIKKSSTKDGNVLWALKRAFYPVCLCHLQFPEMTKPLKNIVPALNWRLTFQEENQSQVPQIAIGEYTFFPTVFDMVPLRITN